jgi:hypothetical protein
MQNAKPSYQLDGNLYDFRSIKAGDIAFDD